MPRLPSARVITSGVTLSAAGLITAWSISGRFSGRPSHARKHTTPAASTHSPGGHANRTITARISASTAATTVPSSRVRTRSLRIRAIVAYFE